MYQSNGGTDGIPDTQNRGGYGVIGQVLQKRWNNELDCQATQPKEGMRLQQPVLPWQCGRRRHHLAAAVLAMSRNATEEIDFRINYFDDR
jgi:hypothetical protein